MKSKHASILLSSVGALLLLGSCGKTCTEYSGTNIPHDVRSIPRTGTYRMIDCPSCANPFELYEVVIVDDSTIVQTVITNEGDTTVTTMKLTNRKEKTLYEKKQ